MVFSLHLFNDPIRLFRKNQIMYLIYTLKNLSSNQTVFLLELPMLKKKTFTFSCIVFFTIL